MQKIKTILIGVLFLSAVIVSSAYATSGIRNSFNSRYGTSSTVLSSCDTCHTSEPDFNNYGQDLANSGVNFAAIEGLDSDGDGFTNLAEITARTFPGDASSFPAAGDTTLPTVNTFTIPSTSSSLTIAISALSASDNVGVTGYLVNESSTKPSAGAAGWSASAPGSYTFATQGAKTLYAWAKDAAGNVSNSRSATVTVTLPVADTTLPTVNTFTIPSTSSSLTIAISALSASDNVGVTGYLVNESSTKPSAGAAGWSASAPGSYTFAMQGAKTLYAWAKDAAGNVSNSRSASVTVTITTPPPPPPGNAMLISPATSHLMWEDNNKLLGIGTMVPKATLHISEYDGNKTTRGMLNAQHHDGATAASIIQRKSRGTEASPAAVQTGDAIGAMHFEGFDGSNYQIIATCRR